jgi:hypothetical protein
LQKFFNDRKQEIEQLSGRRRKVWGLRFHRGTARLFFVIPSEKHEELLDPGKLTEYLGTWIARRHFSLL